MKKYFQVFFIVLCCSFTFDYIFYFIGLTRDVDLDMIFKYSSWVYIFTISLLLILFLYFLNRTISLLLGRIFLSIAIITILYLFSPIKLSLLSANYIEFYEPVEENVVIVHDQKAIVWSKNYRVFFPISISADSLKTENISAQDGIGYLKNFRSPNEIYLNYSYSIFWQYSIIRAYRPVSIKSLNIWGFWSNLVNIGPYFLFEITIRFIILNLIISIITLIIYFIKPTILVRKT